MNETIYEIRGMTCDGCVRSLTNALRRAELGPEFEVRLVDHSLVIRGPHDSGLVERTVAAAGFEFGGRR